MTQIRITRRKTATNSDGTLKTIDQLMRQTMTVLQYGQFVASQQKSVQR